MSKYLISGTITISVWIEVDAENEDAARSEAEESSVRTLCNYCATPLRGVWNTTGELDGQPHIESIVRTEP